MVIIMFTKKIRPLFLLLFGLTPLVHFHFIIATTILSLTFPDANPLLTRPVTDIFTAASFIGTDWDIEEIVNAVGRARGFIWDWA